jgi:hypothetical protein
MANESMVVPGNHIGSRADDPNFLLCMALTYLGLPPGMWRVVVNALMDAASEEYRHRHGQERGSQEFNDWSTAFAGWSNFNKFKLIIVFLGESKIGLIPITHVAALAIRTRVLALLARVGVRMSAIVGASQIVRKVTIYLEIAWIAGCGTYCGSEALATALGEFAQMMAGGVEALRAVGGAMGALASEIIARPVLVARAMLDPSNWDTSPMPTAALVLRLFGNSLWAQLGADNPNTFLSNLPRTISEYSPPRNVVDELAAAMTRTVNARGGMQQSVSFTAELILGLTPLAFVQLLKDWRLLNFVRDPDQVASEALGR